MPPFRRNEAFEVNYSNTFPPDPFFPAPFFPFPTEKPGLKPSAERRSEERRQRAMVKVLTLICGARVRVTMRAEWISM